MCYQFLIEVMDVSKTGLWRNCQWHDTLIMYVSYFTDFPNLAFKIVFALLFCPPVLNGRPLIRALALGMTNCFKYENLLTVVISAQSNSVSNRFNNLNQSNFYLQVYWLLINLGRFSFIEFSISCLPLFPSVFSLTVYQISIPRSDRLLLFFLHFLYLSVLFLCFEAVLLAYNFLVLQLHVYLTILQYVPYIHRSLT